MGLNINFGSNPGNGLRCSIIFDTNGNYGLNKPSGVDEYRINITGNYYNGRVQFPNGVEAVSLMNCRNFNRDVTFPEGVKNFYSVFDNCSNFSQDVKFPSSAINLRAAFYNCKKYKGTIDMSLSTKAYNFHRMFANADINNTSPKIIFPEFIMTNEKVDMSDLLGGLQAFNYDVVLPKRINADSFNSYSMMNYCLKFNSNFVFPEEINLINSNGVINIQRMFAGCMNLNRNIQLPNYSNNFHRMFADCRNLNQNIRVPNSVINTEHMFHTCWNLNQHIEIPSSVVNMYGMFSGCNNLYGTYTIPESVNNCGSAFENCRNINDYIRFENANKYITISGLYRGWVYFNSEIPENHIPMATNLSWFFANCENYNINFDISVPLRAINIQNYTGYVDLQDMFSGCVNLNQNIYMPYSIRYYTPSMFANCWSLNQNIQIPSGSNNIYAMFQNCYSLNQNIFIPSSSADMRQLFADCWSLNQAIEIPNGVGRIPNMFRNCYNLNKKINIPSTAFELDYAFSNCTNLNQSFVINGGDPASSVASGYTHIFHGCEKLNSEIVFEKSSVNSTLISVFENCYSFNQNIKLPFCNGTSISYNNAFANCYNLNSNVYIDQNDLPPNTYQGVYFGMFFGCHNFNQNFIIPFGYYFPNMFNGCWSLNQNINFPETSNINMNFSDTFSYCYNLNQNIKIPSNAINLFQMFCNCHSLNQNIQIPNVKSNINIVAMFSHCHSLNQNILIPGNTNRNYSWVFSNCYNLNQNIQIAGTSRILNCFHMFDNCWSLNQNIWINNVEGSSFNSLFRNCHSLNAAINFNSYGVNGDTRNYDNCFADCYNLNKQIEISYGRASSSTYYYFDNMFANCSNFNQEMNIIVQNKTSASYYSYFNSMFSNCVNLNQNIHFETGLSGSIGNFIYSNIFENCHSLNQNISLPKSYNSYIFFNSFFENCTSLNQNINFPQGTTGKTHYISNMFKGCSNLNQNIILPVNVYDCNGVFEGCINMTDVCLPNKTFISSDVAYQRFISHDPNKILNVYTNNNYWSAEYFKSAKNTIVLPNGTSVTPTYVAVNTNCAVNTMYNIYVYNKFQ